MNYWMEVKNKTDLLEIQLNYEKNRINKMTKYYYSFYDIMIQEENFSAFFFFFSSTSIDNDQGESVTFRKKTLTGVDAIGNTSVRHRMEK
jgi:hypothetical protein